MLHPTCAVTFVWSAETDMQGQAFEQRSILRRPLLLELSPLFLFGPPDHLTFAAHQHQACSAAGWGVSNLHTPTCVLLPPLQSL